MYVDVEVKPVINLDEIIKSFKDLKNVDIMEFIKNSEVVYRNELDLINLDAKYLILLKDGKYYLAYLCENEKILEPLLIQVTNDGMVFDYFLEDFLTKINIDRLKDYFISVVDYSRIMDSVRD